MQMSPTRSISHSRSGSGSLSRDGSSLKDQLIASELQALAVQVNGRKKDARELYSKLRNERERVTFSMMMKMNPEALTAVRKEFFMREDKVKLHEFIYIIQKHLSGGAQTDDEDLFGTQTTEQRTFAFNMCELFREVDVNGDGDLEWQEFTHFVVEKANILNKRLKEASLPHYSNSSDSLDSSSHIRHRHDTSKMIDLPGLGQFAIVEDKRNQIFILNSRKGQYISRQGDIKTDAAPISLAYIEENNTLAASLSNMTICMYSLDDPNPNRKYKNISTWATPGVQMAVTYMPKNDLLYSGATNGDIYSWKIKERSLTDTLTGHNDMVMSLVTLPKLNYMASASLDKTVSIWDAYSNKQLLKLYGHTKGALAIDYAAEYRLLVSAGFEHDACIWSPFVSTMVYRLKGHHHSLVGCQAVKDTPEIITADISGVFKLWDIRNFQCVQTFAANLNSQELKDNSKLGCFLRCNLPTKGAEIEDDSRIYAASKVLLAFDQMRVVHEATTDYSNVIWMDWDMEHMTIITASERNIIIWDALIGSKTTTVNNICGKEISACQLDDRKRKIVIGDVSGAIGVYNPKSGGLMKTTLHDNHFTVTALQYINEKRFFLAGYGNGLIRLFDENGLENCRKILEFDPFYSHPELLQMIYNTDNTVATVGASSGVVRLWDLSAGTMDNELKICDETEHVVQIAFLTPYPLVAVTDSVGNVKFFGSKGSALHGKRISGYLNQTPTGAEEEQLPSLVDRPRRALIHGLERARGSRSISRSHSYVLTPMASNLLHEKAVMVMNKLVEDDGDDTDSVDSTDMSVVAEDCQRSLDLLDRRATEESVRKNYKESEVKWGKVTPALAIGWNEKSQQMYTVDALGKLRSFCLKDLINDTKGSFDNSSSKNGAWKQGEYCKKNPHHPHSAMPPLPQKHESFLLGYNNDASTYLGVRFNWSIEAHEASGVYCKVIPDGILTSAGDHLVKMWSVSGLPLGVLIQSVNEGVRNRLWTLEIDVEPAMMREGGELDDVIEEVQQLVLNKKEPKLEGYNFDGIDPGGNSNVFVRSELRQRIEKTSTILGVDFPVLDGNVSIGGEFDDMFMVGISNWTSIGSKSPTSKKESFDKLILTKSYDSALNELKLSDCKGTFKERNQNLSKLQMRQKAAKVEEVSRIFGAKTGMQVGLIDGEASAQSSLSLSLVDDNVEYRSQSQRGKKRINGNRIAAHENSNKMNAKELLNLSASSAKESRDEEANSFMYKVKVKRSSPSRGSSRLEGRLSPLSQAQELKTRQSLSFVTEASPPFSRIRAAPVKISLGILKAEAANRRCSKYASYTNLEKILAMDTSRIQPLGPEDLQKLKVRRDARKIQLEAVAQNVSKGIELQSDSELNTNRSDMNTHRSQLNTHHSHVVPSPLRLGVVVSKPQKVERLDLSSSIQNDEQDRRFLFDDE